MKIKQLIYLFVALTIPLGFWAVSTLPFQTDVSTYNLASDQELEAYQNFIKSLGRHQDDSSSILVLEKEKGWNDLEDFQILDSLTQYWQGQDSTVYVSSLANLNYPRFAWFRHFEVPFLDLKDENRFQKRMQNADWYADIFEKFLSEDRRFTLLFLKIKGGIDKSKAENFGGIAEKYEGVKVHFIQYDLIQDALQDTIRKDSIWLAVISLLFILGAFYLFTHSLKGLGLIFLMVSFNIAATFLVMFFLEMDYTMHMVTIPAIITVLSFTDIMHILYQQQIHFKKEISDNELRKRILKAVKTPLWLTSLTNIVGFTLFLIFAGNKHLFNFSLAAILGVVIAYLSSRFLVIRWMDRQVLFLKRRNFGSLFKIHQFIVGRVQQFKNVVFLSLFLVFASLIWTISNHFEINSPDSEFTFQSGSLTKGPEVLQEEFFGKKQVEIFVHSEPGKIWDIDHLKRMEIIQDSIENWFAPLYINSPVILAKRLNRYLKDGQAKAFVLPDNLDSFFIKQIENNRDKLGAGGVVDSTAGKAAIVFGFGDKKLRESRELYARLENLLRDNSDEGIQFQLSGLNYLSDEAGYRFSQKILLGLLLSLVFGALLVALLLKSWKKGLGILMVNLFPMLLALSLMFWLEIPVTPLTLFFLSILLGVCVDDSIYLIMNTKEKNSPIHLVPIFITSLVLSVGFLSLAFSSFEWMRPFGWIFLAGILLAYLLDIFVLPVFLNRKSIFGGDG
jgi:predicted RND superfamily exporter protein